MLINNRLSQVSLVNCSDGRDIEKAQKKLIRYSIPEMLRLQPVSVKNQFTLIQFNLSP